MGLGEAGLDAVSEDVALESRERGPHAGERPAARRCQVERLRTGHEPDVEAVELLQRSDQVDEGAAPSNESSDDDRVEFAAPRSLQDLLPLRTRLRARADFFRLEVDGPASALSVVTHRRELHRQRLLILRGAPSLQRYPE